jgi:plasmid maintenance system antidote protein VapI
LARYFKTTPEFWLNLQTKYDLEVAEDEELAKIERCSLGALARSTRISGLDL